ncbi:hypothetical protein ACFVMA_14430 [Streptomyces rochei]|uniref:hypothetical protein n=1 Tax=Streptomyces rochei TaxID=1928 RepID=UPI0036B1D720
MSTASNLPMPNPRQVNGFLVTVSLPPTLSASHLCRGDIFTLPANPNQHLTVETIAPHPEIGSRLTITTNDMPISFTLHIDEPVQPVRMPRTMRVTCRLCGAATDVDLDLVTHGEPKIWICSRH